MLPGVASTKPTGPEMLAVFTSDPVAVDAIAAVNVNVAVPPDRRLTDALMSPMPDAGHDDPAEAAHVHVAPDNAAGSVSVTVAPVTADGPAFDAAMRYVTDVPGVSEPVPSALVIDRSPAAESVSESVALLLPEVGSVTPTGAATDAVLAKVPVAVELIVAASV